MKLDLSGIPMVDNHCHPFPVGREPAQFERNLCIGLYPIDPEDMRHTLYYHMITAELRRFFGLPEHTPPDAVLAHRKKVCGEDRRGYIRDLIQDAGLESLLVDFGYPITRKTLTEQEIAEFYGDVEGTAVHSINRIEWVANAILAEEPSFDEFERRLEQETTAMIREQNLIGLKSVIAYLTGLEVQLRSPAETRSGYYAYLANPQDRAAEKAIRDYTFIRACEICRDHNIPLQVHTGLGDSPDCNLLKGNPFLLYDALNDPRTRDTRIVLIHASYPYLEELGMLLNHYSNLYADLSSMVPYASFAAESKLSQIFELAPLSKLFYGSDGGGIPEHMWFGAVYFRRVLAKTLESLVDRGYISADYAMTAARKILCENVYRVYGLQAAVNAGGQTAAGMIQ